MVWHQVLFVTESETSIRSVSVEVNLRRCCVAGCSTEVAEKLGGPPKGDFLEHWNIGVEFELETQLHLVRTCF